MNGQRLKMASPAPNAPLKQGEEKIYLLSQRCTLESKKHTYKRTWNMADVWKHSVGRARNDQRPKSPGEQ
jgi:hypothetical protein